jgi:poly-gamma-glutamate synthase PgsB/CapB
VRLAPRLSTLHQRTFAEEIREVERVARRREPAAALLRAIDQWGQEAHRWATALESLTATLEGVDGVQQKALLASWLRRHSRVDRLPGDLAALNRQLGLDAIRERTTAARDRLGALIELALVALLAAVEKDVARRPAAGARLRRVLRTHERPPTRRRAASCLVDLLHLEPTAPWAGPIARELVYATRDDADVWVRRQAARVGVFVDAAPLGRLWERLRSEEGPDAALVRAALVEALIQARRFDVLPDLLDDPAEIVRSTTIDAAIEAGWTAGWAPAVSHVEPRTRALLADRLGRLPEAVEPLVQLVDDADPTVRLFALGAVVQRARVGVVSRALEEAVERALGSDRLPVRREAERARAWIVHHRSPAAALAQSLADLPEGATRRVKLPLNVQPVELAVALRPFALEGFGYTLRPTRRGVRVSRGDVLGLAWWRVVHEVRNPAPAKRQGHTHAVGPRLEGPIQVPPAGLAEQSATGVPGQRVQLDDEDWGPHLPTLDDYRRALVWGHAMVVSGSGIVEVERPGSMFGRLRARWLLLWSYDALDQERRSALEQRRGERFLDRFEDLGFGHSLPATGFLPYLLGTSGNTLLHLSVLLGVFWGLLLGANVWMRSRVLLHRRRLGLVVGGWGTRGKSGTERIKAGMLSGVGVPYVSKTTGCEAMILHGPRGDRVRELFLFRPYDKATIWEQADVVRFAAASGARAMLWECMALNPRYVDILQRGWMRDDLSTLTNAYPDHEDVMGPTGMDVARVIGSFAPAGSPVFTAEENMFPALQQEATRQGSLCTPLSRAEKQLIPRELIDRFPYAEHPSNIALAARIGTELGLPRTEAIGWMADHVIPDLGALMVYPSVPVDGRDVVFVNGHSANDELSFTHSWRHTGMAAHRVADRPDEWLVGVVNNRADRVPRSRVFARMVVRVAGAHRFLIIGTNLSGFMNFVHEALDDLLAGLDLDDDERWRRWSEHLKIPDPRGWLFVRLRALGVDPTELSEGFEDLSPTVDVAAASRQADALDLSLVAQVDPDSIPFVRAETAAWLQLRAARTGAERKALLRRRLVERIVLLEDAGASGDQVVSAAARLAPPGLPVRVMGMQNIKGTGLDFVYQWVRWRTLHADLQTLDEEGLQAFSVTRLTAVFHCDAVLARLPEVAGSAALYARVEERRAELLAARSARPSGSAVGRWVRRWAWRVVDPFDAIWRRRRSRQVLADLAMARIGHDEAEQILAGLTKRQKPV